MGIKTQISQIHYDKNKSKGSLFNLLKFCSIFYAVGSELKNTLYKINILKPKKVGAYVISVGNLTTGGVGKTPVVAQIAQYYTEKNEKVAIISRGYGSKAKDKINVVSDGEKTYLKAEIAGDEPFWLAKNTSAVVITSKSRYDGAKYAIDNFKVTKIILDDGFQHRKLHRDLDIVLIDSEKGFGNENLLPAGPLREGLDAFSRIDKLVVVSKNTDHTRAEKYAKIMGKKLKKETFVCYTEPEIIYNIFDTEEKLNPDEEIVAFSAIGQPQQFYRFLNDFEVAQTVDFDDHHNYTQKDVDTLLKLGVKTLVTTEKDAGKLLTFDFKDAKVFAVKLRTKLDVENLIDSPLAPNTSPASGDGGSKKL